MAEPANKALYERVKARVYKRIPKHSAFRSSIVVKEYKAAGGTYKGKKPTKTGLSRWFKEQWRNQRKGVGYKKKGDIYRPTKRVTSKTPATLSELGKKKIARAMREKKATGRVKKFDN